MIYLTPPNTHPTQQKIFSELNCTAISASGSGSTNQFRLNAATLPITGTLQKAEIARLVFCSKNCSDLL
jgi:hypothetical protein